jgi:hypothetical protein
MAKPKTTDERRLLQLQSRELTLRSGLANKTVEHQEVKSAILDMKSKLQKARK